MIPTPNLALTRPLTRHGYGESLYDSGNTYRGNWVHDKRSGEVRTPLPPMATPLPLAPCRPPTAPTPSSFLPPPLQGRFEF